jgi:hypothetical protein
MTVAMELREMVAKAIFFRGGEQDDEFWNHTQSHHRVVAYEQADAVLALPAIANALKLTVVKRGEGE